MSVDLTVRDVLEIAFALVGFFGGWVLKDLHDRIAKVEESSRDLVKAFNDLRVEMPTNYVRHAEHKDSLDNIFNALRRIEDRIDNKADKVIP